MAKEKDTQKECSEEGLRFAAEEHVEDWRQAYDQAREAYEEYYKITQMGLGPNDPMLPVVAQPGRNVSLSVEGKW